MTRILIVDDEENIRLMFKEEFEDEGYEVEVAWNGEEGLAKLFEFQPDLITLDIKMPVLDGIETLRLIRELTSELPVILVSAYGELLQDLSTWAADAYVVKCADVSELKATLKQLTLTSQMDVPHKSWGYDDFVRIVSGLHSRIRDLEQEIREKDPEGTAVVKVLTSQMDRPQKSWGYDDFLRTVSSLHSRIRDLEIRNRYLEENARRCLEKSDTSTSQIPPAMTATPAPGIPAIQQNARKGFWGPFLSKLGFEKK